MSFLATLFDALNCYRGIRNVIVKGAWGETTALSVVSKLFLLQLLKQVRKIKFAEWKGSLSLRSLGKCGLYFIIPALQKGF